MSAYPTCPHGHSDPNFNCPLCRADAALAEQAKELDVLREENKRLRQTMVDRCATEYEEELNRCERDAEQCKVEGDMYGWNFHQGKWSGVVNCDIAIRRELASLRQRLAETERDTKRLDWMEGDGRTWSCFMGDCDHWTPTLRAAIDAAITESK